MSLKTVLETTDGLDEALIPFYTETDGKFLLQIEGIDEHPDVKNLKVAYERTRESEKAIKAERDKFKAASDGLPADFDPEKWEKLKDGKPDEAALVQLRQQLEAERDDWKGKFEAASETARKNALDRDLGDALSSAGVTDPGLLMGARAILSNQVKIGDDGKPFAETDMGPLGVSEFVKRWASGDGKAYVDPGKGGGSKGGDGGGNKPKNSLLDKVPALADLPEN